MKEPHISIKGEPVFEIFHTVITNSVLTTSLVVAFFAILAYYYSQQIQKKNKSPLFYAMHTLVGGVYNLFYTVLHANTNVFFALLGSFFFFILLNNWSGLFPGVGSLLIEVEEHGEHHLVPLFRGGTADLNTTLALSLVSVISLQVFGFKRLGFSSHLSKYFNFSSPVYFFVGILELIQEFARVISFSFRLYGNIFAGEVLLGIITFLLPIAFSFVTFPMFVMEIFVGFVQALVFAMLTAVFMSMAIAKHH